MKRFLINLKDKMKDLAKAFCNVTRYEALSRCISLKVAKCQEEQIATWN
jgi:hypothetical protein